MAKYTSESFNDKYRLISEGTGLDGTEYFKITDLEGNQIDNGFTYLEAIAAYGSEV
jgi:hypothetical protein